MELVVQKQENAAVISIVGMLSAAHLDQSLRGRVRELIEEGVINVILDLRELEHMDSTGVGELVAAYSSLQSQGGSLKLYAVPEIALELLETTSLLSVFEILEADAPEIADFDL